MTVRVADGAVARMERHDRAYHIWRDAAVRDRVLVHVDAHHDMWWFDEPAALTIATFVCAALKEDLVDEVFWVVPDATWERSASRRAVLRHLQRLRAKYPFADRAIDIGRARMSTRLLKKRLTACSAIRAYETSLTLTCSGRRSIAATPYSSEDGRLVDPDYLVVFARLGRLYAAKRDFRAAIENYRMALAGKCDGPPLRLDLAGMYVRQGLFPRGAQELWKGLQLLPAEIVNRCQHVRARVRQARRRRSRVLAA